MSRLIDADEFMKKLASIATLAKSDKQKALMGRTMYCLDNQPTAYDVEKVVEQLEKLKVNTDTVESRHHNLMIDICIDNVRKGGVEDEESI